ncbi:MAG TPA: 4Fe-4S dicluster domain-containing protein [Tissierellia bacterium]|nr:4Fe-4S dicluster domain-containing protein [Tissierellia bacterium]
MKLKIDGIICEGREGETLMEVAKRHGIHIPSLCYRKGFEGLARCRLCLVEVKEGSRRRIVSSCVYPIKENIEVTVTTDEIQRMRKNIIMLLLLKAPNNSYINKLAEEYKVAAPERYMNPLDDENCILCGLCVKACEKMGTNAISFVNRGIYKKVSTPYDDASKDCIGCGACAEVCPTNAILVEDNEGKRKIWNREFNMVKCSLCGSYFATEEAYKLMQEKLNDNEEPICNECRKKIAADKLKESFANIY